MGAHYRPRRYWKRHRSHRLLPDNPRSCLPCRVLSGFLGRSTTSIARFPLPKIGTQPNLLPRTHTKRERWSRLPSQRAPPSSCALWTLSVAEEAMRRDGTWSSDLVSVRSAQPLVRPNILSVRGTRVTLVLHRWGAYIPWSVPHQSS
ncbi:hypothetical protein L227DRAFT_100602 [Lentinus tigrinus ALCF2SS1-6]|uniref:Uncharacterized protein n=1 Tax=Lentinus tigrinus ALCF2SS1-6 TaxID=1328759 RepID=A0A5C2S9A5_9APHY|nr:hypothetical protein L227DRAFT_100602 [Lentinus tigrinus ALCF2SS1-6]